MAEELGMRVEFSAEYAEIVRALDRIIDKTNDTAKALEGAGVNVDKLDRQLNNARKTLVDNSRGQQEVADSTRKANSAIQEQIDRIRKLNQETRALSDARKQLRSNLDTNLSFIPANGPSPRVGSSFGNIVDQDDRRIQQASRSYLNLSTSIDQAIDSKEREGRVFGQESRARWQQLVTDQKAAEKSTRDFEAAQRAQEAQLIRSRYALYDVSTTYAAVAAATLGAVTATGTFAARYETAFTEIERTTLTANGQITASVDSLREQFLDLSEVIPLTFQELTKIGSLGAQLGIAEQDLVSFTETVAEFSRLSGVSAEEAALAFGRIGELLDVPAEEYRNLGSAISFVATESAATDAQIISLTKEIAAAAGAAGFSAAEVVGLGGALASLGVAPERARGALSTYFGTLNQAVAEGGEKLEDFAFLTGLTAEKLRELVIAGEGEQVLSRFAQSLNSLDTVEVTTALDRLGLSQLRVEDTFRRLGQNVDFVSEQLRNAEGAYAQGTFLGDAYAVVLDDVASQFQLLLNSIGRFLATAGQPLLEFLRVALPLASDFFSALSDFASTDFGRGIFTVVGGLTALIGVYALLRTAIALSTASTYALITAQNLATGSGIRGAIGMLIGGFTGLTGATLTWRNALLSVGRTVGIFALVALAIDVLVAKGEGLRSLFGNEIGGAIYDTIFLFNGLAITIDVLTNEGAELARVLSQLVDIFGGYFDIVIGAVDAQADLAESFAAGAQAAANAVPALGGIADVIAGIAGLARDAANAIATMFGAANRGALKDAMASVRIGPQKPVQRVFRVEDAGTGIRNLEYQARDLGNAFQGAGDLGSGAMDDIADGAGVAAKEVRTLVDYGSDLASVFSRAFDLRFGTQLAVDEIANQWDSLADRIRQARLELQGLTAERNVKEYFLSVANAYGDELRAGTLRAEIADINEKIAQTQADASTELQGSSKAARNNRKTLSDLAKTYEDYIVQLAESGADQATLNAAVDKSEAEFRAQALALGYADAELQPYINSFRGLKTVIGQVPRNITVSANVNPAIQALNEFVARAESAGRDGAAGFRRGFGSGGVGGVGLPDTSGFYNSGLNAGKSFRDGFVTYINREGGISFYDPKTGTKSPISLKAFSSGGYTGAGGKYEPAGIVHKGEYVIPKSQVNQRTGLPYADALGNLKSGSRPAQASYAGGGLVSGASMMVSLSPQDRALLRQMGGNGDVVLAVDSREIARASAKGSKQITQEGGRL